MSNLAVPIAQRAVPPTKLLPPDSALGLTWRPMSVDDVPQLSQVVAAIETADEQPYRTSVAEVSEWFDGEWKDHARDTLAGYDTTGEMRAFGQVTTAPGDESVVRAFLAGGVDPEWRGRGIGTALVRWMQGRARQLLADSGKELPGRIAVFLDEGAVGAVALYAAAGFAPIRYFAEMLRPLAADLPDVVVPTGLRIVAWSPERDEQVRLAHNEAFGDHWGSEPRTPEAWALGRSTFAPGWSFVALDETTGAVAGYLLSERREQDWAVLGHTAGYVGVLGVRRAWRGRHLATALLVSAMQAYRTDGMEYAEIGVDTANPSGAYGLYTSLGYEVFHGEVMLTIEL